MHPSMRAALARRDRICAELARGDVVTAEALADRVNVSVRTVYRMVARIREDGVPVRGEAGVGYMLRERRS